jgi:hypothetical protein
MDTGPKQRKRNLVRALFKRKGQTQGTPSHQTTSAQTLVASPHPRGYVKTGDRQRTRTRYFDSAKLLEDAVKANQDNWGSFDFGELKGEPEEFDDSLFREKIKTVMDERTSGVNDQMAWAKCRHVVQCAFTAFSPFAKHFLTIAKEGENVFAILAFLISRSPS